MIQGDTSQYHSHSFSLTSREGNGGHMNIAAHRGRRIGTSGAHLLMVVTSIAGLALALWAGLAGVKAA